MYEDITNKIECNYCGKTIFPFSVYLDMDKDGLIAYCNKECLTNWFRMEIESIIDGYDNQ